jgi:hypothetical protein
MDPNKFVFGINANAGGALSYIWDGPTGFGINIELGKGKFNSEINLIILNRGFGALVTFNGFWPSRIGGFYLGGGISFNSYYNGGWKRDYVDDYNSYSIPIGLNAGYKFVTGSGVYFRTGAFIGFDFASFDPYSGTTNPVYIKPDLAIGWTMR